MHMSNEHMALSWFELCRIVKVLHLGVAMEPLHITSTDRMNQPGMNGSVVLRLACDPEDHWRCPC